MGLHTWLGKMLITPSYAIVFEEVTSDEDVLGIKYNFTNCCDKKNMESVRKECSKPSTLSTAPVKLVQNIIRQSSVTGANALALQASGGGGT